MSRPTRNNQDTVTVTFGYFFFNYLKYILNRQIYLNNVA